MKNFSLKWILLLIIFVSDCSYLDRNSCNCEDFDDKTTLLVAAYISETRAVNNRTATYLCNISEENICYELQNFLARRSDGNFCKSIVGTYSENSCSTANRIGSCSLAETSNLRKTYYSAIWNKTLAQTDCSNLKGTWIE